MPVTDSTLVSNRRFQVGTTTSPLWTIPTGATLARVTIDPNVGDFDDPNLRLGLVISLSADGGQTFPVVVTGNIIGGARTKGGGFPFIEVPLRIGRPEGDIVFDSAIAAVTVNIATRLGLQLTLSTP